MSKLKTFFNYLVILPLLALNACGQPNNKKDTTQKTIAMENVINKHENPYYSNTDKIKLTINSVEIIVSLVT